MPSSLLVVSLTTAARLQAAGYTVEQTPEGPITTAPWGSRVLLGAAV